MRPWEVCRRRALFDMRAFIVLDKRKDIRGYLFGIMLTIFSHNKERSGATKGKIVKKAVRTVGDISKRATSTDLVSPYIAKLSSQAN